MLDIKTAKRLIESGITEFQISLDGPSEIHNKSRIKKDGSGTFDVIWSNLMALKQSSLSFKINIRVHMSKETSSYLYDFITTISKEFSGDNRFRIFLKTIEQLGGDSDQNIGVINEKKKIY